MRKSLSIILTTIILMSIFAMNVTANNTNQIIISQTTEYLEDGSSITTVITKQTSNIMPLSTNYNLTGSKTKTVKNADGEVLFKFKITATFAIKEGVSASCTTVSCSASDLASGWSLDSSSTSKTGNTAKATGVFKHKVLFVTNVTKEVVNTLSCSSSGVLS